MKPPRDQKIRAKIITIDPSSRRIEAQIKDGTIVQVALWEIPSIFRWPIAGETWTLNREQGYWMLGSRLEGDKDPDLDFRIEDLLPGEMKLGGAKLFLDDGTQIVNTVLFDALYAAKQPLAASVASATIVTLPLRGDPVTVTGTTTITSIAASWSGRRVTLIFAGILTLTHGSNLKIAGDFVTTADDSITLICDGTSWFETARSVN